jgi:hypothetical protein
VLRRLAPQGGLVSAGEDEGCVHQGRSWDGLEHLRTSDSSMDVTMSQQIDGCQSLTHVDVEGHHGRHAEAARRARSLLTGSLRDETAAR